MSQPIQPLGYSHLIERYALPALPLVTVARLEHRLRGRETRQQGGQTLLCFEAKYLPADSLVGHVQFALRYEGVNLEVLALLFARTGEAELAKWLTDSPESAYARRACFLYEWLTGQTLSVADIVSSRARYVPVLDPTQQFARASGENTARFRVTNNLPGPREFCPLVSRTNYLNEMVRKDMRARIRGTLDRYDADLLRRAASFLYLKETQSSFEVERERPSPQKAQRFADLLRQADARELLTEDRLLQLQHAVLDPRFHEYSWRHQQNWIGKDFGYRQQVDFVPARPEDLPSLMDGFLDMAGRLLIPTMEPVVAAACMAFGFVYIHPFMDGNGRIHRYLIHDVLAKAGFTPRGIVLPVSAVILANLEDYIETLEAFSRPMNQRTDYNPDVPAQSAMGNDAVYFRYPDLTRQTAFLYRALERTVDHDLQQEIDFLLGFDRASQALNKLLDWPDHSLELFIRVVRQNEGHLSTTKRKSHFDWMTDTEIQQAEQMVVDAFLTSPDT